MKNHNIFPAASIILSAVFSISEFVNAAERESLRRELPTGTVGGLTAKAAIDSVAAVIGASAKSAVFSYGADAYVFINDGTAGFAAGDGLIKLVGVDATLLSTDQNGGLVIV